MELKNNFLTDSGRVFLVIGVIALIVGLLIGVSGIWISGCAAITSGVYLIIKGRAEPAPTPEEPTQSSATAEQTNK